MTIHVMTQDMLDAMRRAARFEDSTPMQWCLVMRPEAYAMLCEARRRQAWIPVIRKRRPGAYRIGRPEFQ